jgi:hypothetical protein
MINENLSPSHTFIRTYDIDLHIPTIVKERKKLVYLKVISSGHTRMHTFLGRQIVLSLLKQQIFLEWLHRKNFTVISFEHQTKLE